MAARLTRKLALAAVAACALAAFLAGAAQAQPITALTTSNQLFTFDSATPGTISALLPVTGLNGGDTLLAIDRNPNTGLLYALGSQSRMYRINEATGAATQDGPVFSPLLSDSFVDMDFDPSFGGARITTAGDQNLIWLPNGGGMFAQTALAWTGGDPNAASNPSIYGLAYTNNAPFLNGSTVFGYHFSTDKVVRLGSPGQTPDNPANGHLNTVGSPGVVAQGGGPVGLDCAPDGTMFALLLVSGSIRLYTMNTATGAMTLVGTVGTGSNTVADIATDPVTNNFSLSASTYDVSESAPKATLTVNRSQTRGFAQVQLATADGTATGTGHDYSSVTALVTFADGEASKTLDIKLRSDVIDEDAETFTATLSAPVGGRAGIVAPASATVTIADDDTGPVPSTPLTALTSTNELVTFSSATPGTVSAAQAVTGLNGAEKLVAIDRRPATGELYGITDADRLYRISETTGAATQVGSGQLSPPVASDAGGFDFDPVADQIRVVANSNGQNLRLDPTTGAVTAESPLIYDATSAHPGVTPHLNSMAYTNNVPFASTTTLFGYEHGLDEIVRIGSPNGSPTPPSSGASFTIGLSGMSAQTNVSAGMDADPNGRVWALLRDSSLTRLNMVDLGTGLVSLVGEIGAGADIYRDIAAAGVANLIAVGGDAVNVGEAAGSAPVTLSRSQSLGGATVAYTTSDGTASAGSDYTAVSGIATFAAGDTTTQVLVPITDDAVDEEAETFSVIISNPAGGMASLGTPISAVVTVADNDEAVVTPPPPPPDDGNPPPDDGNPPDDGKPVTDTTGPVGTTCHKKNQKLGKRKPVVACVSSSEDGTAGATAKLKVRGVDKPFKLKKATGPVTKDSNKKLKLKLSKKARRALAKHGRGTVKVTYTVTDAAGNATRVKGKIKVTP